MFLFLKFMSIRRKESSRSRVSVSYRYQPNIYGKNVERKGEWNVYETHFNDGTIDLKRNNSLDLCLILEIKRRLSDRKELQERLIDFWSAEYLFEEYFIINRWKENWNFYLLFYQKFWTMLLNHTEWMSRQK